jgi:hypothetical protein
MGQQIPREDPHKIRCVCPEIKPNLRYVTEKQLYDEKDGIFADAPARRDKCLERRKDFESGKLNYEDGFMTLD